ncbi:MAG: hypothetical protein FWD17_11680 [Polyangiaceae bacterium]|nr:hypothetical protein [Polyangiaceae bacterium]
MRLAAIATGLLAGWGASFGLLARAEPARAPVAALAAADAPARASGVAVVASAGASDAAWPLAQQVYANEALRPAQIDEAHARVLCGETPPADAPAELRDLADTVAAIHGEDAPSRALLAEIARRLAVAAVVVVHAGSGQSPTARVFLSETREVDAATYAPDAAPATGWSATVLSLTRLFAPSRPSPAPSPAAAAAPSPGPATVATAPALATREAPKSVGSKAARPFYVSPWFWGAVGVAALAGGAAYLLSRDTGSSTIHLELQGPR